MCEKIKRGIIRDNFQKFLELLNDKDARKRKGKGTMISERARARRERRRAESQAIAAYREQSAI